MNIRTHSYRNSPFNSNVYRNSKGFTLVEALVGLVILSLGLLSLARFHTDLIKSSGLTKARTAAVNHGQNKMEELRNMIALGDFIDTSADPYDDGTLIVTGDDDDLATYTTENTEFTRSWTVANTPADTTEEYQADIEVKVEWTDASATDRKIILASKIAWLDPGSGSINTTSSSTAQPTIPFPDGDANTGGDENTIDTSGIGENDDTDDDGLGDGTKTVVDDDGLNNLVDKDNIIVLQSENAFVTIRGAIALDEDASSPEIATDPVDLVVMNVITSDAGFCAFPLIFETETEDGETFTQGEVETRDDVTKVRYTCYVAEGWYGNVGVYGYNSSDTVCPDRTRSYRGHILAPDGDGGFDIVGITGLTAATPQSGDDFLITRGIDCSDLTDAAILAAGLAIPLKGTEVIVSEQVGIIISGKVTINTTSEPQAGSTFGDTGVAVTLTSTNGSGTCTAVVDSGNGYGTYSCNVTHRWSGGLTLTADYGGDKVCISGVGTIGSATYTHTAEELSNIIGEDFDIVEGTGVVSCP